MFDFPFVESSSSLILHSSVFFLFIIGLYWYSCVQKVSFYKTKGTVPLLFLIIAFAVTAWYTGDFWGYQGIVKSYRPDPSFISLEVLYGFIIEVSNNNYLFFRIVVWGSAAVLYLLIAKIFKVNTLLSLFVMFILYVTVFSYARATLAMAIYFLGFTIFTKGIELNKKINIIFGLAILVSSYFYHSSMAVMIILAVFYFVPISKKSIILIIILAVLIGSTINQLTDSFMGYMLGFDDARISEKMGSYLNKEEREVVDRSLFGIIGLIWEYIPFYLTFLIISRIMFKEDQSKLPKSIVGLYRISFIVVLLSTALLVFTSKSYILFYRYLYMSFIPLSILTVFMFTKGYMSKRQYKTIIYAGGGWNIFYFILAIIHNI